MRNRLPFALVLVLVLVAIGVTFAGMALAAPGQLDPTFSGDGRVTVNLGGVDGEESYSVTAVAVQADGKIVVSGPTSATGGSSPELFGVARLLPDGTLDPSFSGDGIQAIAFGSHAQPRAVAIAPDGKILVAGLAGDATDAQFGVMRLNADGSLDSTFSGGKVLADFPGGRDFASEVVVEPDGSVVVAGTAFGVNGGDPALARFTSGGAPDPSFSADGKQTVDFGTGLDSGDGVALRPDGRIVLAGGGGAGDDVAVAQLLPNGDPDNSFGTLGKTTTSIAGLDRPSAVALQADGKIVVVGDSGLEPSIARFETNGAKDLTFDGGGAKKLGFPDLSTANGVAIQSNGRIVVGMDNKSGATSKISLTRLEPSGVTDTSFGSGGLLTLDFGGNDLGGALALQADGQILVAGTTTNNDDLAVARVEGDPVPIDGGGGGTITFKCGGLTATKVGTENRDVINGTNARDVIVAGGGNDLVRGRAGNDIICGGAGRDKILGGGGRDRLIGGQGADKLFGGGGKDKLQGGPGKDVQRP